MLTEFIWLAPNQNETSQEQNPSSPCPFTIPVYPGKLMYKAELCKMTRKGRRWTPCKPLRCGNGNWISWPSSGQSSHPQATLQPPLVPLQGTEVYLTPWAPVQRVPFTGKIWFLIYRKDLVSQLQGKKLQLLQLAGSAKLVTPESSFRIWMSWGGIGSKTEHEDLNIHHIEKIFLARGVGRNSCSHPNSQTTMVQAGYEEQ